MSRQHRGGDNTNQCAKPVPHENTNSRVKGEYEHKDITDNRLVWEVLEEGSE